MSEFVRAAIFTELPENQPTAVTLSTGRDICLLKIGETVYAFADLCTHAEYPMSDGSLVDDHTIECCLHGAQFDLRDGHVVAPPAEEPLPVYPVKIEDGAVWVAPK